MTDFDLIIGYVPGLIGRVAELHAKYYIEHWHFSHFFEAKVASELSEFITHYQVAKDCIWCIAIDGVIEGSLAIDGPTAGRDMAHLRWFIVSERLRGKGAGNLLMQNAISFCEQRVFKKIYLWTFRGLEPARHLYEKHGFKLAEEREGRQWGTPVFEQRFLAEILA